MSTPKRTQSPANKTTTGPESPTTARPLEMDDDDLQDNSQVNSGHQATVTTQPNSPVTETAPAKPPRPLNPQQEAENTLREAFPGIDAAVVKAVLIASGGKIEPAFNALLGMTDPDAAIDVAQPPPPQPPRPARGGAPLSQLEADELYARQLAQHYDASQQQNRNRSTGSERNRHQGQQGQNTRPNERHEDDENYSFIDDELPVIKENLRKGFLETQSKVNGWITNLKKRIDGDDIGEIHAQQQRHAQSQGYQNQQQYPPRRSGDVGRRSGDSGRYDADPQVLSGDFSGIQLSDDTNNPRRSTRPLANPDLFKPTPATPRSNDGRRVSFQNVSAEDTDLYSAPARTGKESTPGSGKQSKWQPLSAVEPNPVGDTDNDPFSLGDSDDEREAKERGGGKDGIKDDADKVKKTTETTDEATKTDKAAGDKLS